MTYKETLDYLFARLPLFSHTGKAAYKTDLTNTITLCNSLNNPEKKFRSIHVAGTNGKGSTSHMLASIFQESGYTTGLYTSPHLKNFRERIKIDGEMISEEFIISFVEKIKALTERIEPSFFEVTVAMAFEYFAKEDVDIAIIETGLGGRLDSTNIITPEMCIITNIGYDHMNILGNSLEEIAFEKAGIIKKNTPVVIGEANAITKPLFIKKANECNAPIIFAEEEFELIDTDVKDGYLEVEMQGIVSGDEIVYRSDLTGLYQQKNIRTVITAVKELNIAGYELQELNVVNGLLKVKENTGLHGRWEVIGENPMVVLDVAHNEDGVKALIEQIALQNVRKVHFVFGMVKDKDANKILSLLPKGGLYYFTNAHIPRALPAGELALKASGFGLKGDIFDDVNEGLNEAIKNADKNDLIVVCGSVFVVAEVQGEVG